MNITLSAEKQLIERSRAYAKKHNTTLNNLVRELLRRLVSEQDNKKNAAEFEFLAKNKAGKSDNGYRFDRQEIYQRGI